MAVQNFFVLTASQRTAVMAFNGSEVAINPRAIDNASPGVGINLNDAATGFLAGDPVTLTGMFVAPKRIVDDPDYQAYVPDMINYLLDKPFATLEPETIFTPCAEDEEEV